MRIKKTKNPRTLIKAGLFAAFLVVLVLIFNATGFKNFADVLYPPIPASHYAYIDQASTFCGVPRSMRGWLAAMAYAESTFNEEAQSGAGAVGVMQVLIPTGYGMAVKYGIPDVNAGAYKKAKQGYLMGTCYTRYLMEQLTDNDDLANWDSSRIRTAIAIAYNAGTGRGRSYLAGSYNGPLSSVGYAAKIERAKAYYDQQFALYDQQQAIGQEPTTDLKSFVWGLILGRKLE